MTTIKAINDKFVKGDALTDIELITLVNYYASLDFELEDIDSNFNLFRGEVSRRLETLRGFQDARKA